MAFSIICRNKINLLVSGADVPLLVFFSAALIFYVHFLNFLVGGTEPSLAFFFDIQRTVRHDISI